MIVYINDRLNAWSDWVARGRKVVGLGYPSQTAFVRLAPSGSGLRGPVFDEDAFEIEQAVHALDGTLRETVFQFYLHAGTAQTHAKVLRCSERTLYNRIHDAHVRVMEWLQMRDG